MRYRDIKGRFMSREAAEKATEDLMDKFFNEYFPEVELPHLKRMTAIHKKYYEKFLKEKP